MAALPVISMAAFDDPLRTAPERAALRQACGEHGFFYIKDHGVPGERIADALRAARAFFALPPAVKARYGHAAQTVFPRTARGYVPPYGETLSEAAGPDPKEIFDLSIERPPTGAPFTGTTVMPDDATAPDFAASLLRLQDAVMANVTPRLLRMLAQALDLPEDYFDRYFTAPTLIQRVIHYPAGDSFAGKHTDNGIFTVLIQEDLPAPSLRVFTRGSWIDAPPLPGTFVVNLGDMLQHWTDGLFASTPHQVIHGLPVDRCSFPFFVYPDIGAEFRSLRDRKRHSVAEIMLRNFDAIWVTGEGAGRSRELV